jgi:hypothetical protein
LDKIPKLFVLARHGRKRQDSVSCRPRPGLKEPAFCLNEKLRRKAKELKS